MKHCCTSPASLKNARGLDKRLSEQARELLLSNVPKAQLAGALCKAAFSIACDGGLHLMEGSNLGNCTIFCCRAIVFACRAFALDLSDVQDASSEVRQAF